MPDWLRMFFRHCGTVRATELEHAANQQIRLENNILPWTVGTAFYAISGAIVLKDEYEVDLALGGHELWRLIEYDPTTLLSIQRAALQDPSKASGLAKMITCTQAFWFCSQCIARLSQGMAISLIELNTFAHCISAFFIYAFWWHKPYDVETHQYIHHPRLLSTYLFSKIREGAHELVDAGGNVYLCIEYSIFETTPDGQVLLVESKYGHRVRGAENVKQFRDKLESGSGIPGTRIPGTGFILFHSDAPHDDRHDLKLSYDTLQFWKRLWRLRSTTRFESQPGRESKDMTYSEIRRRAGNLDGGFADSVTGHASKTVTTILASTFLVYGGLHLLAWQYSFQTNAEQILWRIASTITASSGLIFGLMQVAARIGQSSSSSSLETLAKKIVRYVLINSSLFLIGVDFLARSFLVVESFRALPNSPSSVYKMPRWTAYLPHF
jgi:hypothetical protein